MTNKQRVIKRAKQFCCEPIENIEGYSDMIASDEKWCCHHKRGIDEEKSKQQLINEGLYFDRPASELVIMTIYDHKSLHGKNRRPETKKKNSDAMSGENHFMWGKHHSIESRRKMSESHKGKISGSDKPNSITIVQLTLDGEFVKEWSFIGEAAKAGFSQPCISRCLQGKQKHHKGYKWMCADEYYKQKKAVI